MRRKLHSQGFTLIELLVVITIIAILASISVPVYNTITERAKVTKDISNVKQVVLACRNFAIDNEGLFPTGNIDQTTGTGSSGGTGTVSSSTIAFKELIPDYIPVESIFFTAGQDSRAGKVIPNENNDLTNAENCFSYIPGLNDSTVGNVPLIADWMQAGNAYNEQHVWWESAKAVVGRCDGSIRAEKISRERGGIVLAADRSSNLFSERTGVRGDAGLLPTGTTVANP